MVLIMAYSLEQWIACQDPAQPVEKCNRFRAKSMLRPLDQNRQEILTAPIPTRQVLTVAAPPLTGPRIWPSSTELVGSELKRIISLMELDELVPEPASCGCEDLAVQMNSWGAGGCEANLDYIVAKLEENAAKVGLRAKLVGSLRLLRSGILVNPLDPCRSLALSAIHAVKKPAETFAYGVTTCESRFQTYLPRTIESLAKAGFERPTLFIDGSLRCDNPWGLPQVVRQAAPLGPFGAWITTVWALYTASPEAERYAIFQDDVVASLGLREFLEKCKYPKLGYFNLCTYPDNAKREHKLGWFPSNQLGLGAQGLVFSHGAMQALLSSAHLATRIVKQPNRRWKFIDGAVVTAMKDAGYREYVHDPSLVQHVGDDSSIKNDKQPPTALFRGEDFDLRTLL